MKPYRVIIWGPSGIGNACLREILRLPDFELAGVLGYSSGKNGKDAAALIGLPPAGIPITTDKAAALQIEADCVLYTAAVPIDFEAMNADIVAILESGKNVVSATSLHYAPFHGPDYVERIEAACLVGGTSIHGTGVDPGLMLERLALGATAMCTSVDRVTLREAVDVAHVPQATLLQYGFGQRPDAVADGPLRELFGRWMFVETISFMIRSLYGVAPDRIEHEPVYEARAAPVALDGWTIEAGLVSFIRHRFTGWLGDAPRVGIELVWHLLADQVPDHGGDDADRWQIEIHGQPTTIRLDVAVETTLGSEWLPDTGKRTPPSYHATAAILLQAVPVVCAATPGIIYPTMFTHCAADFSAIGPYRPVVGWHFPSRGETDMAINAEQEIKAALDRVSRGFGTRDPDLASAPYWNDEGFTLFDIMPPFSDSGWATLAKKNEDFIRLTDGPCSLSWTDEHIEASGDIAYFRGIAHFSTTYTDGRPMEGRFRHTLVFRKIDGRWVIVHEHSSQPNAAIGMHPEEA